MEEGPEREAKARKFPTHKKDPLLAGLSEGEAHMLTAWNKSGAEGLPKLWEAIGCKTVGEKIHYFQSVIAVAKKKPELARDVEWLRGELAAQIKLRDALPPKKRVRPFVKVEVPPEDSELMDSLEVIRFQLESITDEDFKGEKTFHRNVSRGTVDIALGQKVEGTQRIRIVIITIRLKQHGVEVDKINPVRRYIRALKAGDENAVGQFHAIRANKISVSLYIERKTGVLADETASLEL